MKILKGFGHTSHRLCPLAPLAVAHAHIAMAGMFGVENFVAFLFFMLKQSVGASFTFVKCKAAIRVPTAVVEIGADERLTVGIRIILRHNGNSHTHLWAGFDGFEVFFF